ncbi:hypothetical protein [Pedococcus sp.]|jgi:hypothetical protein|uniref:hypothetical protein n=1 Tax=Pedococcus sp. TaxID=2860345 RepID=UPI002E0FF666|nr:hypothetical protein [Pedococcus sp.]
MHSASSASGASRDSSGSGGSLGLDRRPDGVSDATVEAAGKVSEAFECIEQVRGSLYAAHRLTGTADLALGEAVELLRKAGHDELADTVDREMVGRNVLPGRWTFQLVEEFDDGYYADFQRIERLVRDQLMGGRRHVFEAEMKSARRTPGLPGHEPTPNDVR